MTGPKEIRPISGNNQSGPASSRLAAPVVARVYDSTGIPVPGVAVSWRVDKGGRTAADGVITDSDGNATAAWFLGDTVGVQSAVVSSPVGDALFSANAQAILGQVSLQPSAVTLLAGGSQQFSVLGIFTDGSTGKVAVNYKVVPIRGGIITSAGLFAAGAIPGTYSVIATQVGGARLADTSSVSIVSGVDSLEKIVILPRAPRVPIGGSQQFAVTGLMSDGSSIVPSVTYTVTGGTIGSGSGLYQPPTRTGTFLVTATRNGGPQSDTTSVTVFTPPPPDPNEPVFTAGVNPLVYQDGFDSYHLPVDGSGTPNQAIFPTTARMETNGTYKSDPAVFMSASLDVGRAGTGKSLRSNNSGPGGPPYGPDGSAGGINWGGPRGTGVRLPAKSAKQVFQYWFKTNPGGGPNSNGTKWFEWWAADNPLPANDSRMQLGPFGGAYAVPGGHMAFTLNDGLGRIGNARGGYAAQPVGPYFDQVNDGQWHRLTIAWLSPTGAVTRDGYVRAWLDGTKIIDLEQATVGVTPPGGTKPWCIQAEVDAMASFQLGHFQSWPEHVNGTDANWTLWVDDFSWWVVP